MEKLKNRMGVVEKVNDLIDMLLNMAGTTPTPVNEIPNTFLGVATNVNLPNTELNTIPIEVKNNGGYSYKDGKVTIMNKGAYIVQGKFTFNAGAQGTRVYNILRNSTEVLVTENLLSVSYLTTKEFHKPILLNAGDTIEIQLGQANYDLLDITGGCELTIHKIN